VGAAGQDARRSLQDLEGLLFSIEQIAARMLHALFYRRWLTAFLKRSTRRHEHRHDNNVQM
jgi:hypothetical protein